MMEPMGVDETLLGDVVRRVLSVARPERINLLGFAATGKMNPDSDLDLLVVDNRSRSIPVSEVSKSGARWAMFSIRWM